MSLALVPVGAVVTAKYYGVITYAYVVDEKFETLDEARHAAVQEWLKNNDATPDFMIPNKVHVALCWTVRYPDGSSAEIEAERHTFVAVNCDTIHHRFGLMQSGPAAKVAQILRESLSPDIRCLWSDVSEEFLVATTSISTSPVPVS